MQWTTEIPSIPGWYWVRWNGYEYPEVVLVTERENEVYSCGDNYMIDCKQVAWWSTEPLDKPVVLF